MRTGDEHYPSDVVGGARQLPGAGILAWLTEDQLHPPMLNKEEIWREGARWPDGARQYVEDVGRAASLAPGEHVLDIGCGVCGPARVLVGAFGVRVTAITNSQAHAALSRQLNEHAGKADKIVVQWVQTQDDWPRGRYDVAWSVNMLYQVADHQELFGKAADLLVPGGRLVVDDWMTTDTVTEEDLRAFKYHFQYRNFVRLSRIDADLAAAGFYPPTNVFDRGDAGRGPMQTHFESVMLSYFLPQLAQEWPDDDGGGGISGRQMALDFIAAVNVTLRLYREGKLTYRTIVARSKT